MEYKDKHTLRKNPSRETCENIIRRILMTEILEHGRNEHFKSASDFMNYFESLYPASDALTKQVQRAVRSLGMPRDELGFFIPNKTAKQLEQEKELGFILRKSEASIISMEGCYPLFIKMDCHYQACLIHMLEHLPAIKEKVLTFQTTSNGLILYSKEPDELKDLLNAFIV